MLNSLLFSVAAAAVLGFLTGLGTGGGSLLMLWLTLVCHMEPEQAKAINLMFFIPAALCATILRSRSCKLPWRKLLLPALTGCVCALVFSLISQHWDTQLLKKIFGLLLLVIGVRELIYKNADQ